MIQLGGIVYECLKKTLNVYIMLNLYAINFFKKVKEVIKVIEEIRKNRFPSHLVDNIEPDMINVQNENDIVYTFRHFQHQHKLFFQHYENMPKQSIPHPVIHAVAYKDINKLYKKAITLSKHFSVHQHDENS